MEKNGEQPPSYSNQGFGYGVSQAPPSYDQANPHQQQQYPGAYPPHQQQQQYPGAPPHQQQQQYPGAPPPQQNYQQYPNVIVQQPMFVSAGNRGPPPPDHMTAAIFATLCCFWPTGILAIIKANDAKNAWMRGDTVLAHNQARSAKTMVNISIIAGICSIIVMAVIIGVYWGVLINSRDYYDD